MRPNLLVLLVVAMVLVPFAILVLVPAMLGLNLPARSSPVNVQWRDLYDLVLWIALGVAVVVFGILIFILVRFKAKPGGPHEGPHIHGNTKLEIAWTIAPTVIMAWLLILSFNGLSILDEPDGQEFDFTVKVEASQFAWTFTYEDGTRSTNGTLAIEQNRVVGFEITSRDVIHAFSVPDLGIMKDAMPSKTTYSWVKATVPGNYSVKCRELCGPGHSRMLATVVVFPEGAHGPNVHWGWPAAPPAEPQPTAPAANTTSPAATNATGRAIPVELGAGGGFTFNPDTIVDVKPNEEIVFQLRNAGGAEHNLYIGRYQGGAPKEGANWTSDTLSPGDTGTLSFKFGSDQTFEFWCQVPGHRDLGMKGTLKVGNGSVLERQKQDLILPGFEPFAVGLAVAAAAVILVRRRR